MDRRGDSFLGYYFAPTQDPETEAHRVDVLTPRDAVLISASGSYGFNNGSWKIIGSSKDWSRDAWPIPRFVRTDLAGRRHYETYLDDEILLPIPADESSPNPLVPQGAVEGGLLDAAAIEESLWQRLK